MKRLFALVATLLGFWATQANAQPITYYIYSAPYDSVSNFTACPLGGCTAVYNRSQRLSGSFTVLNPLGPGLIDEVIDVRLGDFVFNDGPSLYLTDFSDFRIVAQTAQVSTDAGGVVTHFEFKFDKIHGEPVVVGAPANPRSYVTTIYFSGTPAGSFVSVQTHVLCTARGDNVGGNTVGLGCATQTFNSAQGSSQASAPSVTMSLTPPPPPIPTLSEWAMILLGGLLAGAAALTIHRRRLSPA